MSKKNKKSKSVQVPHEYYANAETCRNRWFNDSDPGYPQNEDFHLDNEFDVKEKNDD